MLRKERKWNQINAQLKLKKVEKVWKIKIGTKNEDNKQKAVTNMVHINPATSTTTLIVNGLKPPKKKIVRVDLKNKILTICCLQETHFKYKDTYRLKIKGWRKIY